VHIIGVLDAPPIFFLYNLLPDTMQLESNNTFTGYLIHQSFILMQHAFSAASFEFSGKIIF